MYIFVTVMNMNVAQCIKLLGTIVKFYDGIVSNTLIILITYLIQRKYL